MGVGRNDVASLAGVEDADIDARGAAGMGRYGVHVDRRGRGREQRVFPALRFSPRVGSDAAEVGVELGGAEEASRAAGDAAGGLSKAEVHGDKVIRVVGDARHGHRVTAPHPFLRRLEEEPYLSAQAVFFPHKHLREGKPNRGVSVVPAGVHPAGVHG